VTAAALAKPADASGSVKDQTQSSSAQHTAPTPPPVAAIAKHKHADLVAGEEVQASTGNEEASSSTPPAAAARCDEAGSSGSEPPQTSAARQQLASASGVGPAEPQAEGSELNNGSVREQVLGLTTLNHAAATMQAVAGRVVAVRKRHACYEATLETTQQHLHSVNHLIVSIGKVSPAMLMHKLYHASAATVIKIKQACHGNVVFAMQKVVLEKFCGAPTKQEEPQPYRDCLDVSLRVHQNSVFNSIVKLRGRSKQLKGSLLICRCFACTSAAPGNALSKLTHSAWVLHTSLRGGWLLITVIAT